MELCPVQENETRIYNIEWDKPISKVQMTTFSLYAESRQNDNSNINRRWV
jgi:hypothetical protein